MKKIFIPTIFFFFFNPFLNRMTLEKVDFNADFKGILTQNI